MKVNIYTTISPEFIAEWQELWDNSSTSHAMNSPAWTISASNAYHPKKMKIVAVYDSTKLVAVAPFFLEKIFRIHVFTTPAHDMADRTAILCDTTKKEVVNALFDGIKSIDTVYITGVFEDQAKELKRIVPSLLVFKGDINAYIEITNSVYGDLSESLQKRLFRRIKKADFELISTHYISNQLRKLEDAMSVEHDSLKKQRGQSIFNNSENVAFLENMVTHTKPTSLLSILYAGVTPVAYTFGFLTHNNTYQGNQKAFRVGYEYYSLGTYSVMQLLDYLRENAYEHFDFGKGYDHFKKFFTKQTRTLYNIVFSKNKLVGVYLYLMYTTSIVGFEFLQRHHRTYSLYKLVKEKLQ